ncbi:MAG TPA: M48 family metallopeptidase [Noviherbaspirillum sp.]|nr:M48 family metallopeptidase [Noviherbaspirillum sp.]
MIHATYFDGRSSRRHPVTVLFHKGVVAIEGENLRRSVRLRQVRISEPLARAPRILTLPDGAYLESRDAKLDKYLRRNGYRESWVVRWQRNWPASLAALAGLVLLLASGYQWGLPWAADELAQRLPRTIEVKIGEGQLEMLDAGYMEPSRLPPSRQQDLRDAFASLKTPTGQAIPYRLEFRSSRIGPHAFALPNGVIVMTDQMVEMAPDDHAVLAVLAHELGHLERRHSLRRLLQAAGVGVAVNVYLGDVSSLLALAPAVLLDQGYSRDFEREADRYAIDMMRANGLPLSPIAQLFERLGTPDDDDDRAPHSRSGRSAVIDYLSSHPSDAERIATLRAAD